VELLVVARSWVGWKSWWGKICPDTNAHGEYPFDGLTPLRGKWDEYFLLRALFNKRETKMSPQTYR
jgi:hypothetical protein